MICPTCRRDIIDMYKNVVCINDELKIDPKYVKCVYAEDLLEIQDRVTKTISCLKDGECSEFDSCEYIELDEYKPPEEQPVDGNQPKIEGTTENNKIEEEKIEEKIESSRLLSNKGTGKLMESRIKKNSQIKSESVRQFSNRSQNISNEFEVNNSQEDEDHKSCILEEYKNKSECESIHQLDSPISKHINDEYLI